ncbi:hypothetical protein C0989_006401 [Termitomyces sp. Mn162]|nr:hypothetical protein C0989_006401 [Termitomyces sp. Mn162]
MHKTLILTMSLNAQTHRIDTSKTLVECITSQFKAPEEVEGVTDPLAGSVDNNQNSRVVNQYNKSFPPLRVPQSAKPAKPLIKLNCKVNRPAEKSMPTPETLAQPPEPGTISNDGSYRFTYECYLQKKMDSTKCHPSPSPQKEKTLKRHISSTNPPYRTPESHLQSMCLKGVESPSPQPPHNLPNIMEQLPMFTPVQPVLEHEGTVSLPPLSSMGQPQQNGTVQEQEDNQLTGTPPILPTPENSKLVANKTWMEEDEDSFRGNVAEHPSAVWDSILVDTPPQSPMETSLIGEEYSNLTEPLTSAPPFPKSDKDLFPRVFQKHPHPTQRSHPKQGSTKGKLAALPRSH